MRRLACAALVTAVTVCPSTTWAQGAAGATAQSEDPPESRQEILRRQREQKAEALEPYEVSTGERRVLAFEEMNFPANVFERGWNQIRPVIGGMPSGSGFVGGVSYLNGLDREAFEFELAARASTRLFTSLDGQLRFPTTRSDFPVRAHVGVRMDDFGGLRFFGLGADTRSRDRTTYRLQQRAFDLGLDGEIGRLDFSVDAGWLGTEADNGQFGTSLEERFDPATVPGFDTSTNFFHYRANVEVDLRDEIEPGAGIVLRGELGQYDDIDLNRYDFTRVAGEVQAHVPLGPRSRMLALRARVSRSTPDGGEVPFYLMETLGGGTSIRGFREYRFRDTHTFVMSAEYRWELWAYLDAALFVDAGKVYGESAAFSFDDLETTFGFGLRGHGPAGTVLRFDLARSRESIKLHIGGGPSF